MLSIIAQLGVHIILPSSVCGFILFISSSWFFFFLFFLGGVLHDMLWLPQSSSDSCSGAEYSLSDLLVDTTIISIIIIIALLLLFLILLIMQSARRQGCWLLIVSASFKPTRQYSLGCLLFTRKAFFFNNVFVAPLPISICYSLSFPIFFSFSLSFSLRTISQLSRRP